MGTTTGHIMGYGKTVSDALDTVVSEDQWENGHDGYSGTIQACCGSVTEGKLDQKKFTNAAIERWLDKAYEKTYKRDITYLELPRSYAKGRGRGVRAFIFVYAAPE